ncbi:MFS transporter [Neobacillus sp. LXY-4]|uniref:MFS transporter n=1 Tax=Neobacillus sp. LXY-4 TaxID=3379826 RepID=UPI003EDE8287
MYYGWVVVGLTFFAVLVAAGIRSITGVIMIPLEQEFAWSRSAISFAFAINLTLYGFSGPFIAAGLNRIGIRKSMVYAMLLLLLGMIFSLYMTEIWQLHLIWGLVIGIGCGVFLTVLSATVATNWFEKQRGFVVGLLMASTAAGQMIFTPLLSFVTEAYSWRVGLYIFIALTILMIPIIAIWMRNHPSEKGLLPYGAVENVGIDANSIKQNPITTAFHGLWIGVRSVPFWLLSASFFVCGLSTAGLIGTHFIPASTHHGIPEVHAASLLAFMGIFNIIGSMFSGWLSDRFDNRWLLFWYYGLRGLSLLVLPYAFELKSYVMLIVFAVFYGLDWIATVPPTIRLATEFFGKERGAIIYGWVFAAHQVGSGVAAFLGGYFYEVFNSYTFTFISAGALCILATLFVLSVKKRQGSSIPKAAEV